MLREEALVKIIKIQTIAEEIRDGYVDEVGLSCLKEDDKGKIQTPLTAAINEIIKLAHNSIDFLNTSDTTTYVRHCMHHIMEELEKMNE